MEHVKKSVPTVSSQSIFPIRLFIVGQDSNFDIPLAKNVHKWMPVWSSISLLKGGIFCVVLLLQFLLLLTR